MAVHRPDDFDVLVEYSVSRESSERLKVYHALLVKWQKAINLVSGGTLKDAWRRHFLDSLQLLPFIPEAGRLIDLGSGAGFPGMAVAIARPDLQVVLVDSDERKCQFLKTVSRETFTSAEVRSERVELLPSALAPDVITARGFAPLIEIFDLTASLREGNVDLCYVLLKGRGAEQEVEIARQAYDFQLERHQSGVEADSCILVITGVRKR